MRTASGATYGLSNSSGACAAAVLPAALEAVALAVHLQDVHVVSEAVQQRAGEAFRSEHLRPLIEGKVGDYQDGAPLIAWAEDLEAQFVDDQKAEAGQIPLQVEQPSLTPGPPAVRFTSVSPARRPSAVSPAGVLFDTMALLDHRACGMVAESRRAGPASPSRRPWLLIPAICT